MAGAAVAAGAPAEGINNSTPPVLFGPEVELERMDYEFLDALRRGDETFVRGVIGVPDHADNVTELQTERASWRGVAIGRNFALHIVAGYGHLRLAELICKKLIEDKDTSQLKARNKALETPLHCAARAGADRVVFLFISVAAIWECGCQLKDFLWAKDREGKTALHVAARQDHAATARILMSADCELATVVDDKGMSPLYVAVVSRSLEAVRILIGSPAEGGEQVGTSAGATQEVSYAGPNGQTALHAAAIVESTEIACELLQWKRTLIKEVNILGSTPLHYLVTTPNNIAMVRQLLNCDTTPAYLSDSRGFCPIHIAARMGKCDIIHELINRCHDMDMLVDNQGRNFLHIAVQRNRPMVVKYVCRHPTLVKMLNARDCEGNTPLHLAVNSRNQKIVSLLLGHKSVHPSIMNTAGQTPLDLAITQLDHGLVEAQNPQFWILQCLRGIGATCGPQRLDGIMEENITVPDPEKELKKYESTTQNLVITSVLIATVTFAAVFTMPGGFKADDHQNGGTPTLARKYAFKAFIISNFLAFLSSIIATCWLMYAGSLPIVPSRRGKLIVYSLPFLVIATQSMMAAFALSVYVVLAPVSIVISLVVCVFAFPSILLISPDIWQRFSLAMTLKSRLGWSGMWRTRLIRPSLGSGMQSFYWFIFEQIVWYLLVYVIIFLVPLLDR